MNAPQPRRSFSCLPLFFIIPVLCVGVGIAAVFAPNSFNKVYSQLTGVETIQSRPVEGDPTSFDPIARFGSMQAFAGEGAQLVEFEAYYVRSDGTLDLTATYKPHVTAEFVVEVDAPSNAPPIGAGGGGPWYRTVTIEAYRPNQTRQVRSSSFSYVYTNEGMTREIDPPRSITPMVLQPPICPLASLWQVAQAQGAPADAVATIEYDEKGYEFYMRDSRLRLVFGPDCELLAE